MAIFTRRVIQGCIDQSTYASSKARRRWVQRLNGPDGYEHVATEWEIVLLHTLSKLGHLEHEPNLGGSTKLDVLFGHGNLHFAADITAVSDRGLHDQNPIEQLSDVLKRIYESTGIIAGALVLSVCDLSYSFGTARRKRRIVPPKAQFSELIFNEDFFIWLEQVKLSPEVASNYDVIYLQPRSTIRVSYLPGRVGSWCGQYTDYRVPSVVDKNPLYYALASKADQLSQSGFKGRTGVFLCDGGTGSLRERFSGEIGAREVVLRFLLNHPEVDFVATLSLRNIDTGTIRQRVEGQLYAWKAEPWQAELEQVFSRILENLPRVRQTPDNARSELKSNSVTRRGHIGALSVSYGPSRVNKVRMSTRTLMDLLSGRLTPDALNRRYLHGDGEEGFFQHLAKTGSLIESAVVQRNPLEDDDEIEFTFAGPDPAVAPFRIKSTEEIKADQTPQD